MNVKFTVSYEFNHSSFLLLEKQKEINTHTHTSCLYSDKKLRIFFFSNENVSILKCKLYFQEVYYLHAKSITKLDFGIVSTWRAVTFQNHFSYIMDSISKRLPNLISEQFSASQDLHPSFPS